MFLYINNERYHIENCSFKTSLVNLQYYKIGLDNLCSIDPNGQWPHFVQPLRIVFTFSNDWKKSKQDYFMIYNIEMKLKFECPWSVIEI